MNRAAFPLILFLAGAAFGQAVSSEHSSGDDDVVTLDKPIPHPYVAVAGLMMGGGYARLAWSGEAGIDIESRYVIARVNAAYDNGKKRDDNDQPNPNGHDRFLEAAAYYRLRPGWFPGSAGWFLGVGWSWNQLSTTNYTKGGSRPEFGGGYDLSLRSCERCRRDFSMRINVDWVMAGTDWENGSHGPSFTFTFPTPREKRHWFFREKLRLARFHTTVTDPTNYELTREQSSDHHFTSYGAFELMYRF